MKRAAIIFSLWLISLIFVTIWTYENPENIEYLKKLEDDTGKKINCILQLRHHPTIIEIKDRYKNTKEKVDVRISTKQLEILLRKEIRKEAKEQLF